MATLTSPKRLSDVFIYEATQDFARIAREAITVLAGSGVDRVLTLGMVLGKIATAITASSAAKSGGNTGGGTCGAVTVGAPLTLSGVYKVRITVVVAGAGHFRVTDPNDVEIGEGDVGVAFSAGGLVFTLADGSPDFALGDGFDITVAAGSLKWVQLTPAAVNGSEDASGILITQTVTAPVGVDAKAVAVVIPCPGFSAIIKTGGVVWPAGITDPQKATALAQLAAGGIKNRAEV